VYVIEAVGVVKAVPAVVELLVAVGAFHAGEPVIVTPPAVYPVPDTSLEAEYAVVEALTVALVKYNAALNVSAALEPRVGATPKL
jgi:hypothetical protein